MTLAPPPTSRSLKAREYLKVQILTIEELLHGKHIEMPSTHATFKQTQKVKGEEGVQGEIEL